VVNSQPVEERNQQRYARSNWFVRDRFW